VHRVERYFPGGPAEVGDARRFLGQTLDGWGLPVDDAALVLSELVTNALLHTRGGFGVVLDRTGTGIRIEVSDSSSRPPTLRPLELTVDHGRGLHLVDAISESWGSLEDADGGKTVWAELALA
jgi:hypothetical protein